MQHVKVHFNSLSYRCEIPTNATINEIKEHCIYLFPELKEEKTFFLQVSLSDGIKYLSSNQDWKHLINMLPSQLIHISIVYYKPSIINNSNNESSINNKKQLLSPNRSINLPLNNKLKIGESISIYGRLQSMYDEDIQWSINLGSLCLNNIALRIEFIKLANQIGKTCYSYIINGNITMKSDDYISHFPFRTDNLFHINICIKEDNSISILIISEGNSSTLLSCIPLIPFSYNDIECIMLLSKKGRILCNSIYHSFSLL